MLKHAVNARLHVLRLHKRGQFGRLPHKLRIWARRGGAGIGGATALRFAEDEAYRGHGCEPWDFMKEFDPE